jgi:homoserine O-acetyltransferase
MTPYCVSPETAYWTLDGAFSLESGDALPQPTLAYRTWGRLSPAGDNAVVVCHALTGSADADVWWAPLFGPGRALDPERDFILCSNALGGCYGSSGPTAPAPDGRPWGPRFPAVTLRDQVRAQIALACHLGIRRIRLVLGGSMGGLQALEWAVLDPHRVEAVAAIAASARHSPWCIAWNEAQRMALFADPKYRDGHYDPADPPRQGLAAARGVAMVTYRSPYALARRFGASNGVGEWLRHHGEALVDRFDANAYRVLLDALDSHDLGRDRGTLAEVLHALRTPVLIVSISSDALYLPEEQHALAALLPNATLKTIDSVHGHDGFLIEAERIEPLLREFRVSPPAARPATHAASLRGLVFAI